MPEYDVVAVGNAIVDVLAHCTDQFLSDNDIPKGGMMLIGAEQALAIYRNMGDTVEVAGGSAANSMACLASLGGKAAFVGKVGQDRLGDVFGRSLDETGVVFAAEPVADETPTGRCLISVTPDAERSMMTFIGAAEHVSEADVTESIIAAAAVSYFEGYLFEQPVARKAMVKAATLARAAGRMAAITLSDVGCVERQRGAFETFITDHVDILFANENEALALSGTDSVEAAMPVLRSMAPYVAITRSEKGSFVGGPETDPVHVPAVTPASLVDTTGAGDGYAGGFLYGFTRQMSLPECARIGSTAAAEVISHMGPRPETPLRDLI